MLGKPVPRLRLPSTGGSTFRLSSLRGEKVVLYLQAVCKQFAVIKLKSLYAKKVRGIERSTFVLDQNGVLARERRGVEVPGHPQEVLNFVKAL